jgi:beta-lactam-binding protein with PASTA domain
VRTRIITAALLCAALGGAVACQPTDNNKAGDGVVPSVSRGDDQPSKEDKPAAEKATIPNFVGMGLQSAQDKAQELGFYGLTSHDALGRDRMQAFDRSWKVCSQNVAAGKSVSTDTDLDFGTVKLEEKCPAKEEKAPSAAGGKMPDFKGKSVKAARSALDSGTSITVKDATAEGRWVLVESNWQVCSQDPAAGAALNGQPVEFTAVKFEESCP